MLNAARELRDDDLLQVCLRGEEQIERQQGWALTQVKEHAAGSLVAPL